MNSKYFYNLSKQKKARNQIQPLTDGNGNTVEDEEGLVTIVTSYFRNLCESSNPEKIKDALGNISKITNKINQNLTVSITEWEVKLAFHAMHRDKAPTPYE